MEGRHRERREEGDEETIREQERERGEQRDGSPKPKSGTKMEEEDEGKETVLMKASSRDQARSQLINGHTPISASSSLTSFPFISSPHQGRGGEDEEEVRVAILTVEDESCPSEPFGTTQFEPTKDDIGQAESGGEGKEDGEMEGEEEVAEEENEEVEEAANAEEREEEGELASPEAHLQLNVGPTVRNRVLSTLTKNLPLHLR